MPTPSPYRPAWKRGLLVLLPLFMKLLPVLINAALCVMAYRWMTGTGEARPVTILPAVCYLLSTVLLLANAVRFWKSA